MIIVELSFVFTRKEKKQQYRQCTYNVTVRRIRESLLLWKSTYWSVCACVQLGTGVRGRVHAHKCM